MDIKPHFWNSVTWRIAESDTAPAAVGALMNWLSVIARYARVTHAEDAELLCADGPVHGETSPSVEPRVSA